MIYENTHTDDINIFESAIIEIIFQHEKKQISFIVDWNEGEPITITCENYFHYMIDFYNVSESEIGDLEIRGFSYQKLNNQWIIQFYFEFNPKGIIQVVCSDFYFDVPSKPLSKGGNDNLIKPVEFYSHSALEEIENNALTLRKLHFDSVMWNTSFYLTDNNKNIGTKLLCGNCYNARYNITSNNGDRFQIKESLIQEIKQTFEASNEIVLYDETENLISLNCLTLVIENEVASESVYDTK